MLPVSAVMCNLGTKEGVTDKTNRFAAVWPGVEAFFHAMRPKTRSSASPSIR